MAKDEISRETYMMLVLLKTRDPERTARELGYSTVKQFEQDYQKYHNQTPNEMLEERLPTTIFRHGDGSSKVKRVSAIASREKGRCLQKRCYRGSDV